MNVKSARHTIIQNSYNVTFDHTSDLAQMTVRFGGGALVLLFSNAGTLLYGSHHTN